MKKTEQAVMQVTFRKVPATPYFPEFAHGDIVAFFPNDTSHDPGGFFIACFVFDRGHELAHPDLLTEYDPATPREYATALRKLKDLYEHVQEPGDKAIKLEVIPPTEPPPPCLT